MHDLVFEPATEQAELVRSGQVSPVELVATYLERIEEHDEHLNAFVTVAGTAALEEARKAEERVAGGGDGLPPFHGVPISIKDLNETAGLRTTFSCRAFADYIPVQDASTVRRLREAGFIVLGKTNVPEFGTVPMTESILNGICRNPWDTDRTPGGSSGGAAAALAAGLCPVAQGSDGGGSIRIPASCCGLYGIKPARGRISHGPLLGEGVAGFATDGPIARTVRDAAAVLDVMQGYETGDPYWAPPPERPFADEVGADPGRLRVALTTVAPNDTPVDPGVEAITRSTAELLSSLGHEVEEAAPDWFDDEAVARFVTIWQTLSAPTGLGEGAPLEPLNALLAEAARQTSSMEYVQAVTWIHAFCRRLVSFWDDYDVLLTPTLPDVPPPVGWIFDEPDPWMQMAKSAAIVPFLALANAAGLPAVSLPLGWSDGGLPVGVQLIGGPADEATLIRLSAQLEEARPWADRRPTLGVRRGPRRPGA